MNSNSTKPTIDEGLVVARSLPTVHDGHVDLGGVVTGVHRAERLASGEAPEPGVDAILELPSGHTALCYTDADDADLAALVVSAYRRQCREAVFAGKMHAMGIDLDLDVLAAAVAHIVKVLGTIELTAEEVAAEEVAAEAWLQSMSEKGSWTVESHGCPEQTLADALAGRVPPEPSGGAE